MVIDDAEWLSERAKQAGLSVLDRELDMKVAKAFGVTSMSKAVFERPCRATENHDPSFAAQSQSIQGVMQSDAFISGLRRLIKATGLPVRDGDLAWLRVLNIRPVDKLFSELVWLDGQEVIADSEGESDVLFDFDASQIVASIQAKDVLCERIASVIAHELSADGYSLADRSSLVAMLRSEPSRISSLLTRLRVPKLIDEAEELEPEEDTDAGFIDNGKASEDEAEDGAVCATDEVEALIEGEKSLDEPDRRLGVSTGQRRRSVTTGEDKKASGEDHQGPREDEDCDQGDAATVAEEASGDEGSGEEWSEASSDQREGGRGTGPRSSQPLGGRSKSSRSRSSETASHSRRAVTYVSSTGDSSATESQDKVDHRNRVDQSAMEIVMQYERDKGRNPVPQEHFHPGYDIESKDRDGHVQRYIEVKGLSGAWNDFGVGVKPRQIDKCREEPERFWLYVVEFALESERAQVFAIPNPVALIDEYRFDGGWKALSREQSGIGQPERPEVGRRVRLTDAREGTVQNVETRGVLMRLKVRIDDGEIEDVVYTPSRITVLPDIGVD